MNRLQEWLLASNADEIEAMNELQQRGIISDNCVWPCEVENDEEAVRWLKENF